MSSKCNIEYAPYDYVRSIVFSRSDTSHLLRVAFVDQEERDLVDAINDVDVLKRLLERRVDELRHRQASERR